MKVTELFKDFANSKLLCVERTRIKNTTMFSSIKKILCVPYISLFDVLAGSSIFCIYIYKPLYSINKFQSVLLNQAGFDCLSFLQPDRSEFRI